MEENNHHKVDDVILVVKGAGVHKADDTLRTFLRGFLPAIKNIDPRAKFRQNNDHEIFGHFPKSPHSHSDHTHAHVTEIRVTPPHQKDQSKPRTIWVKEIFWETELVPSSPWQAFFREWRMATFALHNDITNIFRKRYLNKLTQIFDNFRAQTSKLIPLQRERKLRNPRPQHKVSEPKEINYLFFSFLLMYLFIGFIFLFTFWGSFEQPLIESSWSWVSALNQTSPIFPTLIDIFVILLFGISISYRPAILVQNRAKPHRKELPNLQKWIMVLLGVSFLMYTQLYLEILLFFIIPVLMMNLTRGLLWNRRPEPNTDNPITHYTFPDTSNKITLANTLMKPIYRSVVVLGLPILFFILITAKFLKWTKILGAFGDTIENTLTILLGGILGDVSSYAMDPTQAYAVRSVVEAEIKFFCNHADHIHVFAHSQGTPITFETLFQQLDDEYREKIKSYITIGSILSYYYHTTLILGKNYPPTRFRVADYAPVHPDFRWVNCWNLLDPITEFYGLDEFDLGCKFSPQNIKTRARFHSEYWTNIPEVHTPFCNHILGITDLNDFWSEETQNPSKPLKDKEYKRRIRLVGLFSSIITLILLILLHPFWNFNIIDYANSALGFVVNSLEDASLFKVAIENIKSSNLLSFITASGKAIRENISAIVDFTLLAYLITQVVKIILLKFHFRK